MTSDALKKNLSILNGIWRGNLTLNGIINSIALKLNVDNQDQLVCYLFVPNQGITDLIANKVEFINNILRVNVSSLNSFFVGHLEDNNLIGSWNQQNLILPIILTKTDQVTAINRPQMPTGIHLYEEREVTFKNEKLDITLAGTLTIPFGKGPFSAAILLPGSGLYDRNYTYMSHAPFFVLSDYLTTKGIATLRMDSRGVGNSTGEYILPSLDQLANDVEYGLKFLKQCPNIGVNRIGIIGHSGGASVAGIVASKSPDIAFVIMMAGTGINSREVLYEQVLKIGEAANIERKIILNWRIFLERFFDIIEKEKNDLEAANRIQPVLESFFSSLSTFERQRLAAFNLTLDNELIRISWLRSYLLFNSSEVIKQIKCPILALNGALDLQVQSKENLTAIERALTRGGNKKFKVLEIPFLNHMFQTDRAKSTGYGDIEETLSPIVLKIIVNWIQELFN
jgi:Predicted hydrolases or acyltransferases (alpha/beta hydrolase superfamily)